MRAMGQRWNRWKRQENEAGLGERREGDGGLSWVATSSTGLRVSYGVEIDLAHDCMIWPPVKLGSIAIFL